ncbi:hypothetical protein ACVW0K_006643 [Streptomyces filamentosus]
MTQPATVPLTPDRGRSDSQERTRGTGNPLAATVTGRPVGRPVTSYDIPEPESGRPGEGGAKSGRRAAEGQAPGVRSASGASDAPSAPSAPSVPGRAEVREEFGLSGEDAGEDGPGDREEVHHPGVGQPVVDGRALAAGGDQIGPAEHGELLREVRGRGGDLGEQFGDGVLTQAQQLQDADAHGVAERLEELRLQLVERRRPGRGHGAVRPS